jgi:hypothetical protein
LMEGGWGRKQFCSCGRKGVFPAGAGMAN